MPRPASPKAEYRLQQIQRANDSASLAVAFPRLKSLTVDLAYFEPDGLSRSGSLRYKANVAHAKSVFSFVCPSSDCIGGDFDLSAAVSEAVRAGRKTVEGEIRCEGFRKRTKMADVPCCNLLRYKLSLAYT
ncbi:MAG: hypothetical protein U1F98_11375 [Verrucomicrobiota bacterium]